MDNRRCVIRVNTDEQKRVKRQTAYRAIQSTPEFKYFKCSAWLRDQETSEFAQAIVIPDWEDISGTNKRAWEKSATMARLHTVGFYSKYGHFCPAFRDKIDESFLRFFSLSLVLVN